MGIKGIWESMKKYAKGLVSSNSLPTIKDNFNVNDKKKLRKKVEKIIECVSKWKTEYNPGKRAKSLMNTLQNDTIWDEIKGQNSANMIRTKLVELFNQIVYGHYTGYPRKRQDRLNFVDSFYGVLYRRGIEKKIFNFKPEVSERDKFKITNLYVNKVILYTGNDVENTFGLGKQFYENVQKYCSEIENQNEINKDKNGNKKNKKIKLEKKNYQSTSDDINEARVWLAGHINSDSKQDNELKKKIIKQINKEIDENPKLGPQWMREFISNVKQSLKLDDKELFNIGNAALIAWMYGFFQTTKPGKSVTLDNIYIFYDKSYNYFILLDFSENKKIPYVNDLSKSELIELMPRIADEGETQDNLKKWIESCCES